jgi:energy-coupling factor transporter ATP-binding protein EcfA2
MITHRLGLTRDAEKIVVMKNGEKMEEGDYSSLMANRGGHYWKLMDVAGLTPAGPFYNLLGFGTISVLKNFFIKFCRRFRPQYCHYFIMVCKNP